VVPRVCAKRLGSSLHPPGPGTAEPPQRHLWRARQGGRVAQPPPREHPGCLQAPVWAGARVTDAQVRGLSLSPACRLEPLGEVGRFRSCMLPFALGLCHTAAHKPPASPQGFLPSQEPAAPWNVLEGEDLRLQGCLSKWEP